MNTPKAPYEGGEDLPEKGGYQPESLGNVPDLARDYFNAQNADKEGPLRVGQNFGLGHEDQRTIVRFFFHFPSPFDSSAPLSIDCQGPDYQCLCSCTAVRNASRRRSVTGPGVPEPMTRPSTDVRGITSAPLPVMNASSAV